MSGYFLDVQSSALGRPWRARLDSAGELSALAIAQIGGQDELLARVLAGRGVAPQAVERYLDPTLRDLMPDPFCLRDMEAATDRLKCAVERGERIAIFGDYDVDGACSAALMSQYLAACGCETDRTHPRPRHRGLWPERRGDRGLRGERRDAPRHGRLRRRQS